ncbi:MAG: hypothetical protein Q7Q73_17365 [Verrucomicrobiota bacterium JB024]|nr:hypothetical protein [Verrucomicrobiota bacterium JB024]
MKTAFFILPLACLLAGCQTGVTSFWHYPAPEQFQSARQGLYYCNVFVDTDSPGTYRDVNRKTVRLYVFRYQSGAEGKPEKPAEEIYQKQFDLLTGPLAPAATWAPDGTLTVTLAAQDGGQILSTTIIDLKSLE